MRLSGIRSNQSITAITLRHPESGLSISIRGQRPRWWRDLGQQIDLSRCVVVEIAIPAVGAERSAELISESPRSPTPVEPSPTPVELRPGLIERYRRRHQCSIKEIAARAKVTPRALRSWRRGEVRDRSVKSIRIEALLQGDIRSD
jgi:DNA-binding transcriptional regulator YiaG